MKKKKKISKQELGKLIKNHNQLIKRDLESRRKEKIVPENYLISLVNVNKVYQNHVQAVYDFSINIKENEFIAFVGPSGCGKSTTLRMIAGLEDITCGDLFLYGQYANDLLPSQRDAAMVFQSYALYPNMTVYDNLAFSLRVKHLSKAVIDQKVQDAAKLLEIEDYLSRKPSELSGGQRQRVALGRAIIRNAKVFLMDEPLSNLDAKLRVTMRSEIVKLHKKIGATTIYVTHDQTEAMTMADRIVVMNNGHIQQIGTPKEIFMKPSNLFVATFVGSPVMNILKIDVIDDKLVFSPDFKLSIGKKFKSAIDKSFNEEKENILNNIKRIESEIEERKYYLSRPKLLKARNKYLSRKIELNEWITHFENILKKENSKEVLNSERIDSLQRVILNDKNELDKIEKEYNSIEQNSDTYLLNDIKCEKAFSKDEELSILNDELNEQHNKSEILNQMYKKEVSQVLFGIRPENISVSKNKTNNGLEVEVDYFELLGNISNIHFYINGQKVVASLNSKFEFKVGEKVYIEFAQGYHLFNPLNEKSIYEE